MQDTAIRSKIDGIVDNGMLRELPTDRLWALLGELDDVSVDYDRELAISYICSNLSDSKHLCQTVLRGKHDDRIRGIVADAMDAIREEIAGRRTR